MAARAFWLFGGYFYGIVTTLLVVRFSGTRLDPSPWLSAISLILLAVLYFAHYRYWERDSETPDSRNAPANIEGSRDEGLKRAKKQSSKQKATGDASAPSQASPAEPHRDSRSEREIGELDGIAERTLQEKRDREGDESRRQLDGGRAAKSEAQSIFADATVAPAGPDVGRWSDTLPAVWRDYWLKGDGHFDTEGLRTHLVAHGLEGDVVDGESVGANDSVLVVEPRSRRGELYLLPSFTKPPRAVQDWFEDRSGGGLAGKTQNVLEVAVARRNGTGFELVKRGSVS